MSILTPFKFRYDLWRSGAPTRRTYGVSYKAQLKEAWELFKLNELEPYEYNDFHLADPKLSSEEKTRFMSYNQACVFHRELNPSIARGVLNKWVFAVYMQSYGIATPRVYGLFDPQYGYTVNGDALCSRDDVKRVLDTESLSEFVIKPASGAKGFRVTVIVERRCNKFVSGDGREYTIDGIYDLLLDGFRAGQPLHRDGILIQERVRQHEMLDRINPHCANTIRVVTFINNQGEIEVLMTQLKFGRGRAMVDNVKQGGFLANVRGDGTIEAGSNSLPDRLAWFDKHPDTGQQISGLRLPHYHEAVELAKVAQHRLPQLRSLGFDIAITGAGATIVEGNAWWSNYPQLAMRKGFISDGLREVLDQIMPRKKIYG